MSKDMRVRIRRILKIRVSKGEVYTYKINSSIDPADLISVISVFSFNFYAL